LTAKISSAKFTNWRFSCCRWASFFQNMSYF